MYGHGSQIVLSTEFDVLSECLTVVSLCCRGQAVGDEIIGATHQELKSVSSFHIVCGTCVGCASQVG